MRKGSKTKVDKARIRGLYRILFGVYGPQGWWPLPFRAGYRGFDERGYHPGDFSHPRSTRGRLEIFLGAVLTQNTAWTNVEAALRNLDRSGINSPSKIASCRIDRLARLIKPSGYYNQKARKLKELAALLANRAVMNGKNPPSREALLAVWGVGEETADSILLYAYRLPFFVVDAYTSRLLSRIGWIRGDESYGEIQAMFHAALKADHALFNEYHALIVEHAKKRCRSRPVCEGCPIRFCASRTR
jgi:endonuclease-3 related protein